MLPVIFTLILFELCFSWQCSIAVTLKWSIEWQVGWNEQREDGFRQCDSLNVRSMASNTILSLRITLIILLLLQLLRSISPPSIKWPTQICVYRTPTHIISPSQTLKGPYCQSETESQTISFPPDAKTASTWYPPKLFPATLLNNLLSFTNTSRVPLLMPFTLLSVPLAVFSTLEKLARNFKIVWEAIDWTLCANALKKTIMSLLISTNLATL